jgi:hypothetical protein
MRKMGILKKEEKEILQKIEDIYNNVIKKYIGKNNLYEKVASEIGYYPLSDDEDILFVYSINYIDIYFFDGVRWLIAGFNEDGKLLNVSWAHTLRDVTYKDYIFLYNCLKELSIKLV